MMVFAQIICLRFPGSPWSAPSDAFPSFPLRSALNYSRTANPGDRNLQLRLPAISLLGSISI